LKGPGAGKLGLGPRGWKIRFRDPGPENNRIYFQSNVIEVVVVAGDHSLFAAKHIHTSGHTQPGERKCNSLQQLTLRAVSAGDNHAGTLEDTLVMIGKIFS